jgi:hypothetical protein
VRSSSEREVSTPIDDAVEDLRGIDSPSAPVVSVYLNLFPERLEKRSLLPRMRDLMHPLEALAQSGELDHDASQGLHADIQRVFELSDGLAMILDPAAAVFVSGAIGLERQIILPSRIWDVAVAGPRPYLRPLEAVLDEYRRVATVVIDARLAEIFVNHMGETLAHEIIEAEELRKSNLAGWHGLEEYRHRQHAEEERHRLFRQVAERLRVLARRPGIDLIFIGGQRETTLALLPFLDHRLQDISQTFVTDVNTLTPAVLRKTVADLEQDYERGEEAGMVEEVYAMAAEGDMAVVGLDRVLMAANRHAIGQLFIHDGVWSEGSSCPSCGALSPPVDRCTTCGAPTEKVGDVFEALVAAVVEAGGSVEHVMAETELARDLVAGRLRFGLW